MRRLFDKLAMPNYRPARGVVATQKPRCKLSSVVGGRGANQFADNIFRERLKPVHEFSHLTVSFRAWLPTRVLMEKIVAGPFQMVRQPSAFALTYSKLYLIWGIPHHLPFSSKNRGSRSGHLKAGA